MTGSDREREESAPENADTKEIKRLRPSEPPRADTNGETLFLITPLGAPDSDRE
jgi:hypothetical protein